MKKAQARKKRGARCGHSNRIVAGTKQYCHNLNDGIGHIFFSWCPNCGALGQDDIGQGRIKWRKCKGLDNRS